MSVWHGEMDWQEDERLEWDKGWQEGGPAGADKECVKYGKGKKSRNNG